MCTEPVSFESLAPRRGPRPPLRAPRRNPVITLMLIGSVITGCANALTGDPAVLDRFAAFEVQGTPCTAPVVAGGDALGEASAFRFRQLGLLLDEVRAADGRVRYGRMSSDPELRDVLRVMRDQLARVDPGRIATRDARLAFWLNAYNALVLAAATEAWMADPAFRVDAQDFAFFQHEVHQIGGVMYSLNQIENGILRGDQYHPSVIYLAPDAMSDLLRIHGEIWGDAPVDPRIHFALNCASSSCPDLYDMPIGLEPLDEVLDRLTRQFLSDSSRGAGPGGISQIFQFYAGDFDAVGGVELFMSRYLDPSEVDINRYLGYDWSLNISSEN